MQPVVVSLYVGQLSAFGMASLRALLNEPGFRVCELFVPQLTHWEAFYHRVYRGNSPRKTSAYRRATVQLRRLLRQSDFDGRMIPFELEQAVSNEVVDFALSLGFPVIFPAAWIEQWSGNALNVHPSLLPRCRGANPTYWTVAKGEPSSGISTHEIVQALDAGPIWAQTPISFDPLEITERQLRQLVVQHLPRHFRLLADQLRTGGQPVPQAEEMATYYRQDQPADHRIRWEEEGAVPIDAKVRAGKAFAKNEIGESIYLSAEPGISRITIDRSALTLPGTIVETGAGWVRIRTIDGAIRLQTRRSNRHILNRIHRRTTGKVGSYGKLGERFL